MKKSETERRIPRCRRLELEIERIEVEVGRVADGRYDCLLDLEHVTLRLLLQQANAQVWHLTDGGVEFDVWSDREAADLAGADLERSCVADDEYVGTWKKKKKKRNKTSNSNSESQPIIQQRRVEKDLPSFWWMLVKYLVMLKLR